MVLKIPTAGLYNVQVRLINGMTKTFKRVTIDNEQIKLGNLRLTPEQGDPVLLVKSDLKGWSIDSKDCQ